MLGRRKVLWAVSLGLGVVALAVMVWGAASAATDGGPGYASVPGPAFQPQFSTTNFRYFHMQVRTESGTGFFVAPVYLPQGARLNQMTLLGYDDDPSNILQVTFYRAYGGRGFIEEIASLDSTGATSDFELSTTTNAARSVVDNERYGYFVELQLPAPSASNRGLTLSRVRVGYSYSSSLPLIEKNRP
ncbi:MAG: hypothetical protein KIT87_04320 [Anaerolineae bacterium]|nr:hypothetical protein [Anaerolineae bacterium]